MHSDPADPLRAEPMARGPQPGELQRYRAGPAPHPTRHPAITEHPAWAAVQREPCPIAGDYLERCRAVSPIPSVVGGYLRRAHMRGTMRGIVRRAGFSSLVSAACVVLLTAYSGQATADPARPGQGRP